MYVILWLRIVRDFSTDMKSTVLSFASVFESRNSMRGCLSLGVRGI